MSFETFTTQVLPYLQVIIIGLSVYVLKEKIKLKDAQIETLKNNFESTEKLLKILPVDEYLKNMDLRLENKNLEMKKILDEYGQKVYEIYLLELQKSITEIGEEFSPKFKELLLFAIEHINKNKLEDIEVLFPLNKTDILELLEDIKTDF